MKRIGILGVLAAGVLMPATVQAQTSCERTLLGIDPAVGDAKASAFCACMSVRVMQDLDELGKLAAGIAAGTTAI